MNEQVIDDLYARALQSGYKKGRADFVQLIQSNEDVFNDMYQYVQSKGYAKDAQSFSSLVGKGTAPTVKKKVTASVSEPGSLVSPEPEVPVAEPVVEEEVQDLTVAEPDFFEERMAMVSPQLIDRGDEDEVAKELTDVFKPYGFEVEPTSIGDALKVTAANGETIEVDLDPMELPSFLSVGRFGFTGDMDTETEKSEAKKLQDFLRENRQEGLDAPRKFVTQEQIDTNVKKINESEEGINKQFLSYVERKSIFDAEFAEAFPVNDVQAVAADPEGYNDFVQRGRDLDIEAQGLRQNDELLKEQGRELDKAAGEYTSMLANRGDWGGGLWNKMLTGIGRISEEAYNVAMDKVTGAIPLMTTDPAYYQSRFTEEAERRGITPPYGTDGTKATRAEFLSFMTSIDSDIRNEIGNKVVDDYKKERKFGEPIDVEKAVNRYSQYAASENMKLKGGELEAVRNGLLNVLGDSETTPEWTQLKEQGFWAGAFLGLAESIPAMVVPGGWAARTAAMYGQVASHLGQEMASIPEFQDVSEKEKAMFKLPLGIVVGALESIGFRNVVNQKGLLNSLLMQALKKSPKNVTGKAFNDIVDREVNSMISRGLLKVGAGGLAEFETGLAQEIADITGKEIYNALKEKEMFDTPESFGEGLEQVVIGGLQEAVGGLVLGVPNAVATSSVKKDFTDMDDATFELFQNVSKQTDRGQLSYRHMFYTNLKSKINQGKISKKEAQQQMDNLDEVIAVNRDIPSDLTLEQQKRSLGILLRKKDLQEQIEGKDPILVKRQQEELNSLNRELDQILYGTPQEDAIQEPSPETVDAPEPTRGSEAVGEGVPDIGEPTAEVEAEDQVAEAAPTAEVAVEEGAEVELEVTTTDKKGRTLKFFKTTTEKDGVKTTRFTFNRSDKSPEQRITSKSTPVEEALGGLYEVEVPEGLQENGAVPVAVTEVRESESGASATVVFEQDGQRFEDEVVLNPKAKEIAVEETVSEPTQEVTEEEQVDIDDFFSDKEIEGVDKVDDNLVVNRKQLSKDKAETASEERKISRIKQIAKKAAVSLKKEFPDVRIVLHETEGQYKRFAGERARGTYLGNEKTIHINLSIADLSTVGHEVFHALLLETVKNDPNAVIVSRKMLDSIKKVIDPNSKLSEKIDKFVAKYENAPIVQDEEYLAELMGILSSEYRTLDKPAQNTIKEFLRKLAKLIGIDNKFGLDEFFGTEFLKTDAEVIDLLNTVSRKVSKGAFIEAADVAVIDKISKKSTPEELKKARKDVKKALDEQDARKAAEKNLLNRSQAASNFTDEQLTAFAKEGILFHGSDMQKEFFDSRFIKEFNYGYGFYFTGVPALARKYGDKLSFVDTKEFNLLDGDEDITQEDAQDMLDNLPGYGLDNEFVEEFLQDYIDDEGFENDPQSWSMFITEYISDYESKAEIFSEYLESELGFDGMTTVENAGKGAVPTVAVVWNFDLLNENILQDPTKGKVVEEEATKEVTRKEEAAKDVLDFVSLVSKGTSEDVIYLNKRQQVEGINPKDVRMRSRSGNRVGKGLSVKKVNNEAVVEEIPDLTLDYVRENAPASYLKNANLIAQYPLVRGVKNFDDVSSLEQADEVYEVYARQVADNLNWIMESYPEEYREISTLWYDGANKIANELAADYGVSPEQVAGIIASLSPQNDWYQNVRAAELLLLAFRENPVMSQKMIDYQVNYAEGKINKLRERIESASKEKGKSQARAKVAKFKKVEAKNLKSIADAEALLDLLRSYKGKRMEDAPDALKPYYVRLYSEVNQPKSYPIISPDGNYGSDALADAGGKRKFGWGSYTEIGKGVSIRLDGSQENTSVTLGQMHKIRNFFNNIIDPMSKEKDITMDTHAIAAALLIPASSKTKEVVQNFGTGTANSGVKGQKGLYYANQAGYFLSAEENNMLPRQVQSVTWEAVRGLFTSKFKDGAKNVKSINDIWENYAEGNITIEEARQEVLEKAGGINPPSWAGLISDESRNGDGTTTERGRGKRGGPATEREGVAPRQQVVYHVTIRKNKGNIQKKGLEKDRPATWAKGIMRADSFDTAGKSFAFSNLKEATKWGIKTKIEKDKEVSIVAINAEGKNFQEDKAVTQDPFNPLSSAVFTEDVISPSDILSIEDVDYKFGEPFDKSGEPLTEESFDIKEDIAPRQQLADIDKKISNLKATQTKASEAEYKRDKAGKPAYSKAFFAEDDKFRKEIERLELLKLGLAPAYEQRVKISEELDELNKPFEREVGNKYYPRLGTVSKGEMTSEDSDLGGIYEAEVGGYLFRGVSVEDYNRIKKEGFIDTDLRGAISDKEGINLTPYSSTAFNYLPEGVEGVVMAIKVSDKSGLFMIGADDYVRSSKPIPFTDVEFVTTPVIEGRYLPVKDGKSTPIAIKKVAQPSEKKTSDVAPRQQKPYPSGPQEATEMGYLVHASDKYRDSFDKKFIKGRNRTELGALGFYFTANAQKAMDYGGEYTYIDPSDMNLLNLDEVEGNKLQGFLSDLERNLGKLSSYRMRLIAAQDKTRSISEFNEIDAELKKVEAQIKAQSPFGTSASSQDRVLQALKEAKAKSLMEAYKVAEYAIESRLGRKSDADAALSDLLFNAGYDGIYEGPGLYKVAIFDIDGLNNAIVKEDIAPRQQLSDIATPLPRQQKSVREVVQQARDNNFKDAATKDFLKRKGVPTADIDKAIKTLDDVYARVMKEIDGVITKSQKRGVDFDTQLKNALAYLQGTKLYEDTTDIHREKLMREVRAKFDKKEKRAPSAKRILGNIKDVKTVTLKEKEALKMQLRLVAKTAKTTARALVVAGNELTKSLKEMVKGGVITANQMSSVLRRFSRVDLFNPASIDSFLDYMAKIFADAEYGAKIARIKKLLPRAKKNIKSKIGVADVLGDTLTKLFNVNPTLIPMEMLEDYQNLLEMMGAAKKVLPLADINDVTEMANKLLNAVYEEVSMAEDLAEVFANYENKVIKDGKVDYAATVRAMIADETISEAEATVMIKYKSRIVEPTTKEPKTEEELAEERAELMSAVEAAKVNVSRLVMDEERTLARQLAKLIRTEAIDRLSNQQLETLLAVIDNINNGFVTHAANRLYVNMNALNNDNQLADSLQEADPLSISKFVAKIKGGITQNNKFFEAIKRRPLAYIDSLFGDFKTNRIYNSIFRPLSKAFDSMNVEIQRIEERLDNAENAVRKSFKRNPNKVRLSSYKRMTYMLQREFEANPENGQVNPAADFIRATIDHINEGKSFFKGKDAEMLQQILDDFGGEQIDSQKLYDSFNKAERNALAVAEDINKSLASKASFTAAVIQGRRADILNQYAHHNVLSSSEQADKSTSISEIQKYNQSLRASTKAKNSIERTGAVTPLNFDVLTSVSRGAKMMLTDFYLTDPVRTSRKTISNTRKVLEERGNATKQDKEILNAIDQALELALDDVLIKTFTQGTMVNNIVQYISKTGYRVVLASVSRFGAEALSNSGFVSLFAPKQMALGLSKENMKLSISSEGGAVDILSALGSTQISRLFPDQMLSGRMIDTSVLGEKSGDKGGRAYGEVANKMLQIYNGVVKPGKEGVERVADGLISTPDKAVIRPLWFGSFEYKFEELTKKKPDMDKIAANDEAYMDANQKALDEATDYADQMTTFAGAADNPFKGLLKGKYPSSVKQSALLQAFNISNSFMTRFLIYEFISAQIGTYAMMGKGMISKRQGAALLGAVATRMVVYTLLTTVFAQLFKQAFGLGDEEEEKDIKKQFGQALASTATSLIVGRDFGNVVKGLLNYGVENLNEEFLDELRDGDYDPYRDAIAFTFVPPDKEYKSNTLADYIRNLTGPFGPFYKMAEFGVKTLSAEEKKDPAARIRQQRELNERLPLEVLGNLGLIPLYRDIRALLLADIYKGMGKDKKGSSTGMTKAEKAQMKEYFPEMYEMQMQMEEEMKNPELERMMKEQEKAIDEMMKGLK